jgi:two-component system, chemotaxis family, CheB/CheR fusion protein
MALDSARALTGIRVLLVEDTADTRDVFAMLLASEGADVRVAETARQASEIARSEDIDVLLTDLGLPDIPGDMLITSVLRQSRRRPRVIVVTGYGEPYVTRARAAGADVVLTKPVSWSRLVGYLRPGERGPAKSGKSPALAA